MERNILYRELNEFDYDTKVPAVTMPKKLGENTSGGYTCYVEIDLGLDAKSDRCFSAKQQPDKSWKCVGYVDNPIKKTTAIYAPTHFDSNLDTDLIIFLHGHLAGYPGINWKKPTDSPSIQNYLEFTAEPFFKLREPIEGSGNNTILIAPTLGPRSQYGILARKFDGFIEKAIAAIEEYVIIQRGLKGAFKQGRIIIAAHSGGGSALLSIVNSNNKYAKLINECWGFDSWYGNIADTWKWIAKQKPGLKIYGYYYNSSNIPFKPTGGKPRRQEKNFCTVNARLDVPSLKPATLHFTLLGHYFKERLTNAPCINKTSDKEFEFLPYHNFFDRENGKDASGYKLTKIALHKDEIVVGKYYEKEKVKGKLTSVLKATIEEAPDHFLPIIVDRAMGSSGKDWFNNFTQIEFLGRKFKSGQYIHIELAKVLQVIEKKFAGLYGGPGNDPKIAGDFLLGANEGLSGSREKSSTATFSMHMFGLAMDVNYWRNPFIEKGDIATVNAVLERAGLLIDRTKPAKYFHGMNYDGISKLDKLLEKYFNLLEKDDLLLAPIKLADNTSPWYNLDVAKGRKIINTDLANLAKKLARGDKKEIIKKGGILDLPKEFVEGMIDGGLDWGGFYGDMMHFDLRNYGVGKKIQRERIKYQQEKNEEAKTKHLSSKKK